MTSWISCSKQKFVQVTGGWEHTVGETLLDEGLVVDNRCAGLTAKGEVFTCGGGYNNRMPVCGHGE